MKKQLIYILAAAALVAGCAEKEAADRPKGYGSFRLGCTANPDITTSAPKTTAPTRAEMTPSGDAFRLTLTGEGYAGEWATVAEFEAADTLFVEGRYTAEVTFGDPDTEGFDKPYYHGNTTVNIEALIFDKPVEIVARIANSLVTVRATEQFHKYFHDAAFTIATASGNSFEFRPGDADYTGDAAYVKAGTSLTVNGTARRQSQTGVLDGPSVSFDVQTLDATVAQTRHTFVFDAANAGSATLDIFIGTDEHGEDKYIETRILDIELNEGALPNPTE